MVKLSLRHRHRLRTKEVRALNDELEAALGIRPLREGAVDRADAGEMSLLLQDGVVVALLVDDDDGTQVALTVRGLLAHRPTKAHVTVDMGAVPYVTNGADVMAPGIVDADPGIEAGDLVWIRDQRNEQPLGVGRALVTGPEMVARKRGKAVASLHHVGDELWDLEA